MRKKERGQKKTKRENRPLWNGYYTRKTPTKVERIRRIAKKHKFKSEDEYDGNNRS